MKKSNVEKIIYKLTKISHPNYLIDIIAEDSDLQLKIISKLMKDKSSGCKISLEDLYSLQDEEEQSNFIFNKLSILIAECVYEELNKINNFFDEDDD